MMRYLFCLVIPLFCFPGCTDRNTIPSEILPPDKMEKILWDMIQADRFSANFLSKDSAKNVELETFKLYEDIFQIHKITRSQFIESYKFYLGRPDITKVMLDSLSSMANRKRGDVYKLKSKSNVHGAKE